MKVKCKNCGKIFDAENYSCLCPHCGTWYIPVNQFDIQSVDYNNNNWSWTQEDTQTSVQTDTPDSVQPKPQRTIQPDTPDRVQPEPQRTIQPDTTGSDHTDRQRAKQSDSTHTDQKRDAHSDVQKKIHESQENRDARKNSRWTAVVLAIVVGIIVMITVEVIGGGTRRSDYYDDSDDYEDDSTSDDDLEEDNNCIINYGSLGDSFDIHSSRDDGVYTINSIEPATIEELTAPSGYELYSVEYTIKKDSDPPVQINSKADVEHLTSDGEVRVYEHANIELYLRTKTGVMLSPLSCYYMEDIYTGSQDIETFAEEENLDMYMSYSYGRLLFMVKEDDYDCLVAYVHTYEDGYANLKLAEIDLIDKDDDTDSVDWLSDTDDDIPELAYDIDDNVYVKEIEEGTVFTPSDGVNISIHDLFPEDEHAYLRLNEVGEKYYLIAMRMTNNLPEGDWYPHVEITDAYGYDRLFCEVEYSSLNYRNSIPPKTTETFYYIARISDRYDENLIVTYDNVAATSDSRDESEETTSELEIALQK